MIIIKFKGTFLKEIPNNTSIDMKEYSSAIDFFCIEFVITEFN